MFQQLATVWLSVVFCVQGQQVVPYEQRVSGSAVPFGFNQGKLGWIFAGVVRPENYIASAPLSNAPPNPRELPNLRIPAPALEIGQTFRRPDGQYGIGSIFENGRTSIPAGASIANGRGSLGDQLGLGNLFVERAAGAGAQGEFRRVVRLGKRAVDESLDIPAFDKEGEVLKFESTENQETLATDEVSDATPSAPLEQPAPLTKEWQYDGGYKYRLAKAAIKSNPRKGISFKLRDGEYKMGSVFDSTPSPVFFENRREPLPKKYIAEISAEADSNQSKPLLEIPYHGELPSGAPYKKPEGEYGIGTVFAEGIPSGFEKIHHLAKRQAVGSGKVTPVVVEFDKDAETHGPVNPPASSQFRPGFGFHVQVPPNLDERTSKLVLKNVVFRKRPGAFKPAIVSDPPKKPVLKIPDSIELPPSTFPRQTTAGVTGQEPVTSTPAQQSSAPTPAPNPTSGATIGFRPTFPAEHFPSSQSPHQLNPLNTPVHHKSPTARHFPKTSAHPPLPTFPPKSPFQTKHHAPKPLTQSHKLSASPLVAVPPGQIVYNRQLASSIPAHAQPFRSQVSLLQKPPASPSPLQAVQQVTQTRQVQPAPPPQQIPAPQPTPGLQPATALPQAPRVHQVQHVQSVYPPPPQLQSDPPAPAPVPQPYPGVVQSPGALYQQYSPFDPATYPVAQPGQFDQPTYGLPYPTLLSDPFVQARTARSAARKLREDSLSASSVYALSKRIVEGVHS
ncbi:unnamed protein product [Ixodes hexagonus]